jgi:hypothetical protein
VVCAEAIEDIANNTVTTSPAQGRGEEIRGFFFILYRRIKYTPTYL